MDTNRQVKLSSLSADTDKIVKLQSGTDTIDPAARRTRCFIAILFAMTWCFLVIYFTCHPAIKLDLLVPRTQSWLWSWMWPFPVNDKGISTVSAASMMLVAMIDMMGILTGYFFTKMGK
jgi:hypothetical protein